MNVLQGRKAGAALAIIAAGAMAVPAAAQAAARRTRVAASSPRVTRGAADRGALPRSQRLALRVYLAPNGGQDALNAAVKAVSDPASPSYRQFLTPAQYRARFAPTDAQVAAVRSWLTGQGIQVTGENSRYLTASGPASAVEAAFGTGLHQYSKDGDTFRAPTGTATVPSDVAGHVLAVSGLDTAPSAMKPTAKYPPAFVNAGPCSQYYGQVPASDEADGTTPLPKFDGKTLPYAPCGYQPKQFRSAYEGTSRLTGQGQTVAITDAYAAPTILSDANTYATKHGDAAFAKGQFAERDAKHYGHLSQCDSTGWYGEETLDVEAVHGMAPKAGVLYYGAASCYDNDLLDALAKVVDDNQASVVTNSWGEPESGETADGLAAYEQVFQQGALQGITFLFSSGDDGDEVANTGTRQSDYPASDPYVTAVGGTATGIGRAGGLVFQTGWGTDKYSLSGGSWSPVGWLYGAGGGESALFARPSWQQGVVPAGSGRAVPDVAMDADPTTGMLVGETQQFPSGPAYGEYRIGGTSLASPLMAGFQALTNQRAGREGWINQGLYGAAGSGVFNDVAGPGPDAGNVRADYANSIDASGGVLYSVRTFDQDSGLDGDGAVKPGWDEITGLGVPSPQYLSKFGG